MSEKANIFVESASSLQKGESVVLLGAPSVGKTYELINNLIPRLDKENVKTLFLTSDINIIKKKTKAIEPSQLNQLRENELSERTLIIDDFYRVFVKCKEKELLERFFDLFNKCRAIYISTTPYRLEYLFREEESLIKNIFDRIKFNFLKFEIFEKEAEEKIKKEINKENPSQWLPKCQYGYNFEHEKLEKVFKPFKMKLFQKYHYFSYAPFALLSIFSPEECKLSRFIQWFKSEEKSRLMELGSSILLHIREHLKQVLSALGVIGITISEWVPVVGALGAIFFALKKRNKRIIEIFSELNEASFTELEMAEKIAKLPPLTLYNFREIINQANSQKILDIINAFPDFIRELEKREKQIHEILEEYESVYKE